MSYSKTIPAKFPFGQRSFLKATFFDDEKQLLVSKSILRDDMPAVRHNSEALPCPTLSDICANAQRHLKMQACIELARTAKKGVALGAQVLLAGIDCAYTF